MVTSASTIMLSLTRRGLSGSFSVVLAVHPTEPASTTTRRVRPLLGPPRSPVDRTKRGPSLAIRQSRQSGRRPSRKLPACIVGSKGPNTSAVRSHRAPLLDRCRCRFTARAAQIPARRTSSGSSPLASLTWRDAKVLAEHEPSANGIKST